MIKKLLILFSVSIVCNGFSQTKYTAVPEDVANFHLTVSSAERMFKNDSLLQAFAKYDMAFSSYNGAINPTHYFKAAMCALKIKEEYKALQFLEKALSNGYVIDSLKRKEVVFYNQNTKKEYLANKSKWEALGTAERNKAWEKEIYETVDQTKKYASPAYQQAAEYCASCLKNPKCLKTAPEYISKSRMVKEKMKADSLIAANLVLKIKKFGFPDLTLLDKKACEIARNILLSFDADKKNELLDGILSKAIIDGKASPMFYAKVIDRRNLYNGLPPEFYEPLMGYEKTISKDMAVVNERRKKIGLYNIIVPGAAALKVNTKDPKAYGAAFASLYDY